MTKEEALFSFWSGFGLPAYDELTVPKDAELPYITYESITDSLGFTADMSGSIWYRSTDWSDIDSKKDEIAASIGYGHKIIKIDDGYMYITKGTPFAQRMSDDTDDMIRRVLVNLNVEYLTAH